LIVSRQKNQDTLAVIGDGELASNTPFPPCGVSGGPHQAAVFLEAERATYQAMLQRMG